MGGPQEPAVKLDWLLEQSGFELPSVLIGPPYMIQLRCSEVSAVRDLERLGPVSGRRAAAEALSNVVTEYQARFMVTSLRMLTQWSRQNSAITDTADLKDTKALLDELAT